MKGKVSEVDARGAGNMRRISMNSHVVLFWNWRPMEMGMGGCIT
jgi:hypothetical protein